MRGISSVLIFLAILYLLAGCAQYPNEIAATAPIGSVDCTQLQTMRTELEGHAKYQTTVAALDAINVGLWGVPLASATGGDRSAIIAELKGKIASCE